MAPNLNLWTHVVAAGIGLPDPSCTGSRAKANLISVCGMPRLSVPTNDPPAIQILAWGDCSGFVTEKGCRS